MKTKTFARTAKIEITLLDSDHDSNFIFTLFTLWRMIVNCLQSNDFRTDYIADKIMRCCNSFTDKHLLHSRFLF